MKTPTNPPFVRAATTTALLLLAAACATPETSPAWIDSRQHPKYPSAMYLIGVGTAVHADRDAAYQQARDRAVADIAGQLETHIRSEVTSVVRESVRVDDQTSANSLLSQMSTNVEAIATGTLGSIRPVEQHYDEATRLAAALVVIQRTDFADQAAAELAELDGKVDALLAEARALAGEGKLFQAVRRYTQIEQLLVRHAAVAAQSKFAMPAMPIAKPPITLADAFAQRREAATRVQLVLLSKHDQFGAEGSTAAVDELLVERFAELGLIVTPGPRTAGGEPVADHWHDTAFLREQFGGTAGQPLLLLCDVTTTTRAAGDGDLISVRSSGEARLLDANSGELLITLSYSPDAAGRAPAIGRPARRDSLVVEALAQLAEQLATRLLEQI